MGKTNFPSLKNYNQGGIRMKQDYETKANILKKVNKKIKIREIKIAIITVLICLLIGIGIYFILFGWHTPISSSKLKNVRIETKRQTIGELDARELEYNQLCFDCNELYWYKNLKFYVENDDQENTATLYFYLMGENNIEKMKRKNNRLYDSNNIINCNILLYPKLCNTDKINEITKVCYLIYNYEHLNKEEFNEAKTSAIVLWEK